LRSSRHGGDRGMPQPARRVVLVDMDGVIADFDGRLLTILKERHQVVATRDHLTKFPFAANFPADIKPTIDAIMAEEGFFRSFEPIPGAIAALREMQAEEGLEVFICTAPIARSRFCHQEKVEWVRAHLDDAVPKAPADGTSDAKRLKAEPSTEWVRRMVVTSDKSLVRGDLLIDDAPQAKASAFEPTWEHVWYRQPYNASLMGRRRLGSWGEWRGVVMSAPPTGAAAG